MKNFKIAHLVIAISLLLVGCSTPQHPTAATEWEYKVVGNPDGSGFGRRSEEKFLNDNAEGGWVLVDTAWPDNGMRYIFQRPKK